MTPLASDAIAGLGALGNRFVGWRWETRNGRPTKPPVRPTGAYADSTDPASWCSLDEAIAVAERPGFDGMGFVLDAIRDGIVGVDLDGCRDPSTGGVEGWATGIINGLLSYTEVSPSGTGVKILVRADPVPRFAANKVVIHKANGSGKDQAVEVYTTGRYFCLTGQILPGVPDEIVENTEAVEKLAHWIAKQAGAGPTSDTCGDLPRLSSTCSTATPCCVTHGSTAASSAMGPTRRPAPWTGRLRCTCGPTSMTAISRSSCVITDTARSAAVSCAELPPNDASRRSSPSCHRSGHTSREVLAVLAGPLPRIRENPSLSTGQTRRGSLKVFRQCSPSIRSSSRIAYGRGSRTSRNGCRCP